MPAFAQLSLDELLSRSVKGIRAVLKTDSAIILLSSQNRDLIVRAMDGIDEDIIGMRVAADTGFAGLVANKLSALTIKQELPPSPLTDFLAQHGMQALSGVPLVVDKRLLGVLYVGAREARLATDDELRFLSLVGDRVALAIERVRFYDGERIARAHGAAVSTARSAAEGLTAISANLPDVLISDIEMPAEDGYSFMRRVRALPSGRGSEVPSVALTAHANAEARMRALSAGFHIHVPKPVETR